MVRRTRRLTRVLAACAAVAAPALLGACRPAFELDFEDRQSQIESIAMRVKVTPRGGVLVAETVTFAGDDGGTIALPEGDALAGDPYRVEIDGRPVEPDEAPFGGRQVDVESRQAVVTLRLPESLDRYADVAILRLTVVPSVEPSGPGDPDADLALTVTLPEGSSPAPDDAFVAGRSSSISVGGDVLEMSSRVPVWMDNELIVGFDAAAVPQVEQTPLPWRSALDTELTARRTGAQASGQARDTAEGAEKIVETAMTIAAIGIPGVMWLFVLLHLLVLSRARRVDVSDVPEHLADPPGGEGPGVVSVLEEKGRPARAAVAGELLSLAHRRRLRIDEHGGRVLVTVPLDAVGADDLERLLLGALRERTDERGRVEGPPLWPEGRRFWRRFRRLVMDQAQAQGLVARTLPLTKVSGAVIATGVGVGLFYFTHPVVYMAIITGSEFLAAGVGLVAGWRLTERGHRVRALWRSFARYITDHGELGDVGPAGVATWGPYVVYGTVLGQTPAAAEPLAP